jgi:hypothetical protein
MKTGQSIITDRGDDLSDYYQRLIEKTLKSKFVKIHPDNCWSGDWIVDGNVCFLVTTKQDRDGLYFVYCCGTDDLEMAIRDLTKEQSLLFYDKIQDGISQKQLEEIGFVFGG